MTSLASVRAFAQRDGDTPVHVLVNNAGVRPTLHHNSYSHPNRSSLNTLR